MYTPCSWTEKGRIWFPEDRACTSCRIIQTTKLHLKIVSQSTDLRQMISRLTILLLVTTIIGAEVVTCIDPLESDFAESNTILHKQSSFIQNQIKLYDLDNVIDSLSDWFKFFG